MTIVDTGDPVGILVGEVVGAVGLVVGKFVGLGVIGIFVGLGVTGFWVGPGVTGPGAVLNAATIAALSFKTLALFVSPTVLPATAPMG